MYCFVLVVVLSVVAANFMIGMSPHDNPTLSSMEKDGLLTFRSDEDKEAKTLRHRHEGPLFFVSSVAAESVERCFCKALPLMIRKPIVARCSQKHYQTTY